MTFKNFVESNANDIMATSADGFGKDFIEDDVLIGQLLERVETSKSILSKFNFKKMLNGTQSVPVRGKKIRMRLTQESTDTTGTTAKRKRVPTGKMTITATELVVTIPYSDTFAEDSVVNAVTYIMNALYEAFENSLVEILINGDTATADNTNINIIDGVVNNLPEDDILAIDGLRKKAIEKAVIPSVGVLASDDFNL
jgi:HK97 family phage major capsid protein